MGERDLKVTVRARDIAKPLMTQAWMNALLCLAGVFAFVDEGVRMGSGAGLAFHLSFAFVLVAVLFFPFWKLPRAVALTRSALEVRNVFGARIAQHRVTHQEERDDLGLWLDERDRERVERWFSRQAKHASWYQRLQPDARARVAKSLWELDVDEGGSTSRAVTVWLASVPLFGWPVRRVVVRLARDGLSRSVGKSEPTFYAWSEIHSAEELGGVTLLRLHSGKTVTLGRLDPSVDMSSRVRSFGEGATLAKWIRNAVGHAVRAEPEQRYASSGYRERRVSPIAITKDPSAPVPERVAALCRVAIDPVSVKELEEVAEESAAPALREAIAERLAAAE